MPVRSRALPGGLVESPGSGRLRGTSSAHARMLEGTTAWLREVICWWPLCSPKPVPSSTYAQRLLHVCAYLRSSLAGCTHCHCKLTQSMTVVARARLQSPHSRPKGFWASPTRRDLYASCKRQTIFIRFQHSARNGCGLLAVHSAQLAILDHTVHLDVPAAPMPALCHTPALSSCCGLSKTFMDGLLPGR